MPQHLIGPREAIHNYAVKKEIALPSELAEVFVPGRIEVLGKHTDYAGGSSITAALSRGLHFFYAPRRDKRVVVHAVDFDEHAIIDPEEDELSADGHWSAYTRQVVKRIFSNFGSVKNGADIFVTSTLPIASGMSSSSAFVVGTFICLGQINDVKEDPDYRRSIHDKYDLADYLSTVENGGNYKALVGHTGVGTLGGSEDHTAILASQENALGLYRYRPTTPIEFLPWPQNLSLIILSSGVIAEKSGSARSSYNRASRLAADVIAAWNEDTRRSRRHLGALVTAADFDPSSVRSLAALKASPEMLDRFDHFNLEETELIPGFVESLKESDVESCARYINRSASAADKLLDNQVAETRYLMRSAIRLGAMCASPFGAGFGGSVYAIAASDSAEDLGSRWLHDYLNNFPHRANLSTVFVDRPQRGVQF